MWGPVEEQQCADNIRKGTPYGEVPILPPVIKNAPEIQTGLELYWDAYHDLSSTRAPAFEGVSPIPWTALLIYSEKYEFSDTQFEWLVYITGKLDDALQKYHRSKAEAAK